MLITMPRKAQRFINYLQANGGKEVITFIDENGNPNLEEARIYAEKLKLVHNKYVNELISIVQSYNKVTISVIPWQVKNIDRINPTRKEIHELWSRNPSTCHP